MTRRWRWSRNAGSGGADSDGWMLVFSQPPSWREDVSGRWIADYGWSLTISVSPGRCHETGLRARHGRRVVPEIEDLYQTQARELDRKKRERILHQIQQIMYDRVMHVPIYELAFLWGVGPRVEEA